MRNELNNIEKIDQYINGLMTDADKLSFESEISADPALAQVVDGQKLFLQAVRRKALRAEILAVTGAAGAGAGLALWKIITMLLGGAGVIVLGVVLILNANGEITETSNEIVSVEESTKADNNDLVLTPLIDSLIDQAALEDGTPQIVDDTSAIQVRSKRSRSSEGDFVYGEDTPCDGLKTMVRPDIQEHIVQGKNGKTVEGKKGTLVIIPPNAFLDQNDKLVKGPVDFELVEALTLDDMILYNLTTTDGDKLLETGGMVYVNASQNGAQLKINPEAPLYIEVPTDEVQPGMVAFEGKVDNEGDISWVNPKPLKKFLVKFNLTDLDFLPQGFEDEVVATMPFKGHKTANDELVDSLYYALSQKSLLSDLKADSEEDLILCVEAPNEERITQKGFKDSLRADGTKGKLKINVTWKNANVNEYSIPKTQMWLYWLGEVVATKKVTLDLGSKKIVPFSFYTHTYDVKLVTPGYEDVFIADVEVTAEGITEIGHEYDYSLRLDKEGEMSEGLILMPKGSWSGDKSDTTVTSSSDVSLGGISSKNKNIDQCGIDPMSIKAIRTSQFQNTFIATKEFEERLSLLHQLSNGQELFDLYVNNLGKDLSKVDALVANKMSGDVRKRFEGYAALNLTNLKDAEVHQEQLSKYYSSKVKEYNKSQARAKKKYDEMSTAQLQVLQNEFKQLSTSIGESIFNSKQLAKEASMTRVPARLISKTQITRVKQRTEKLQRLAAILPRPSFTKNRPVYATQWYSMGWMNIDEYLHLLEKGSEDVKILASTDKKNLKVYQYLNTLNTIVGVNLVEGKGVAKFPKKGNQGSSKMKNAICFSVSVDNGNYSYSENHFNPYNNNKLEVEPTSIALRELRSRLSAFEAGRQMDKMLDKVVVQAQKAKEAKIKREELAAKRAAKAQAERVDRERRESERQSEIARKGVVEAEKREKLNKERDAVNLEIEKEQDRLRSEFNYMEHLRSVAFPCKSDAVFKTAKKTVPNPTIDAPNLFSPNDDGKNDVWIPVVNNVKSAEVVVKSAIGKFVFKGVYPELTWNGTNQRGDVAKNGKYVFVISGIALNDSTFSQTGSVELRVISKNSFEDLERPKRERRTRERPVKANKISSNKSVSKQDIKAFSPNLNDQVLKFLEENLNYPPSLLNNKVSGQVTLKMDVNQETGSIGSIIVSSSPNDLMSKEVIRVLKLIPEALLIGSTNGMVKRQVNITFNLK